MEKSLMKTLIVVILDESGSMNSQKQDVIGGYEHFLDMQKDIKEDQARLVLITFNTNVKISHGAVPVESAPKLTAANYKPGGGTALYDAVAEGIRISEASVQSDERVLILIMTDGAENSSRKTSQEEIRKLIKQKEDMGNYTFSYIGENPGAWASAMQQSAGNVRPYNLTDQRANMMLNTEAVQKFRRSSDRKSNLFYS